MAKAKAEQKTKIYNKGKRGWPLEWKEGEVLKKVFCKPSYSVEVPQSVADRMIKNYPADFVSGDSMVPSEASNNMKKLKSENGKLKKLLEEKDVEIAELKKLLEDATPDTKGAAEDTEAGGE